MVCKVLSLKHFVSEEDRCDSDESFVLIEFSWDSSFDVIFWGSAIEECGSKGSAEERYIKMIFHNALRDENDKEIYKENNS